MSDTERKIPHWARPVTADELEKYDARSRRRMERLNRRIETRKDGAFTSVIGGARSNTPNGYDTWDEVWGQHRKRKEKRITARLRRRTATIDNVGYDDMVDA